MSLGGHNRTVDLSSEDRRHRSLGTLGLVDRRIRKRGLFRTESGLEYIEPVQWLRKQMLRLEWKAFDAKKSRLLQ
jgi:hypothetical protein